MPYYWEGGVGAMEKLTIIVDGDSRYGKEHRTTFQKPNGKEMKFYTDGYEGISFKTVTDILDFVGAEYFVVHRN